MKEKISVIIKIRLGKTDECFEYISIENWFSIIGPIQTIFFFGA